MTHLEWGSGERRGKEKKGEGKGPERQEGGKCVSLKITWESKKQYPWVQQWFPSSGLSIVVFTYVGLLGSSNPFHLNQPPPQMSQKIAKKHFQFHYSKLYPLYFWKTLHF